jgi:hypothetical protein
MTDVFTQGWKGIRMVRDGDLVAIFNNIHRVMKAEKILKERGVSFLLIPAPRALKSDCGLALRYIQGDRKMIEKILHESGLAPEEIYRKSGEDFIKVEDSCD